MQVKKQICLWMIVSMFSISAVAQPGSFAGKLTDETTKEKIIAASVTIYRGGNTTGLVSNREGDFYIKDITGVDSLKISMISYENKIITARELKNSPAIITLKPVTKELMEVVLKPQSALDLMEKAIKATAAAMPQEDYENNIFYREQIRDRENYFSVAEAVFKTQYAVKDKSLGLQLVKGRSKEDVSYTRLFEDFHPGGGPEEIAGKSLSAGFPPFMNLQKTKWFNYKKEAPVNFDGAMMYVISFDQQPGVKEALEKGKVFINADDFTIRAYEAENSTLGMPYIKDLKGTDKLFAELLNIDFKRKSWKKKVFFTKPNDRLLLSHAETEYYIGYKQPKKNLDLDLAIITEMVAIDPFLPLINKITKATAWKRKNLVANLPTDYAGDFWGEYNVISPTKEIEQVIETISKNNKEQPVDKLAGNWQYFQKDFLAAWQQGDSLLLLPVMKGSWEDEETAGMLYKEIEGDFSLETSLSLSKKTDSGSFPDNGFQQAGLIIRNGNTKEENNIILNIGTAGNSQPKLKLQKTENGKSKGPVEKGEHIVYWLKLEKKGKQLTAFYKTASEVEWEKITTYNIEFLGEKVQAGVMVMARFAGNGPKAKPDMKAIFTGLKIIKQ